MPRTRLVRAVCLTFVGALVIGTTGDAVTPQPGRDGGYRAQAAPTQRWGSASGQNHLEPGEPNRTLPATHRGRYPKLTWQDQPTNKAEVHSVTPTAHTGFDQATSRELPDQRGAYERVYANADGTETTEFSSTPIHYQAEHGRWAPIDTRLSTTDSGWQNLTNSVHIRLAPQANATELAHLSFAGNQTLAYGLADANPAAGVANGSTVTYPGVRPNVDLQLEARPGGVKETLVLKARDTPRSYTFRLNLKGLNANLTDGQLTLTDPKGALVAIIPPGDMVDAKGERSSGVTYRLAGNNLELTLDEQWLADPARQYPVQVDPTVTLPVESRAADSSMYVRGNGSALGSSELQVGQVAGASTAAYLKFGSLVTRLQHHTIFGAQLQVINYDANSCRARPVTVHPVTEAWTAGTGHSYPGPSFGAQLATASFAHGYVAFGQSSSACPTDDEWFNLGAAGANLVQGWVDGAPNNGLSLRANVSDPLSGKRFAGSGTANPPKLWVTHSPYNAQYAIPNPVPNPPVMQNQDGKVKVTVTNRSAEAWAPGSYYLAYRAYNAITHAAVGQQRSADLTATVARGGTVTLDATIKRLPPGRYFIDFTMVRSGGIVFTDHQVPPARIMLEIIDVPPVVQELHPPNGYQAPTLTPQLWGRALDIDAPPGASLSYKFEVCERDAAGNATGCFDSGYQPSTAWTVPSGRLSWSKAYLWRVFVKDGANEVASPRSTVLTEVPQPDLTSRIAGAPQAGQEQEFDAQIGNFSTVAADATVTTVGPELNLIRTYNSLDPRRDGLFGAGWTTRYDMRLVPDDDGSGNVVITYPDGQAVRFGRNPNGSYATPAGRTAALVQDANGWKLTDRTGVVYQFAADRRLVKITDVALRSVVLTYNSTDGKLAKAQVSNGQSNTAGRSLRFTWSGNHISAVTTDLNTAWSYTYTGDLLTSVCAPGGACTRYAYTSGSHYRSAVLDSRPESYWRLGEAQGSAAGSEIAVNVGKDAATYTSVTLGAQGIQDGDKAATFNGTSSRVDLPKGTLKKSRDMAMELWFKANPTGTGGPLLGYQDKAFGTTPGRSVPILYLGTDGKLRGQFGASTIAPIASTRTVNEGQWHHVALSVMGSTLTMYLDGVPQGTQQLSIEHSLLTYNQVGAASVSTPVSWPAWGTAGQRFFNGVIDEVAVYSHPLGAASVATHHRHGSTAADQISQVTLPSGRIAASVTYDVARNRVATYTDRDGGTWKLGAPTVYGGDNDLRRGVQVLDPANRAQLFEYDALTGQLLRSGTPLGISVRDEDRPDGPIPPPPPPPVEQCSAPDPGDPQFCTIIPGNAGGPVFVRHPLDGMAIRTFGYDDKGNLSVVTNENGDSVTMTHDARGNVVTRKTCRTAGDCQTSYTTYPASVTNPFDPRNELPVESRDARSANVTDPTYRTTYTYTPTGDLATQTEPDGSQVKHTYTSGGEAAVGGGIMPAALPLTTTDARGKITRYAYYANGDLARVTAPSGLVTTFTYDALGRVLTETETSDSFPSGTTTTYAYDALSRPVSETQPATTDVINGTRHQLETVTTYDIDGNVTKVDEVDRLGGDQTRTTTTEYDDHGRPVKVTDPQGGETTSSFDRFGNVTSTVDDNGNRYDFAYTARNMLAEERLRAYTSDSSGGLTNDYLVLRSLSYDFAGRLASETDAMGRRQEYLYYGDDRLRRITLKNFHNPDGSTRDYVIEDNTYDAAGNRTKQVTGNGTYTVTQTFDRGGNVATTVEDPAGLARTTTFSYDAGGNVTRTSRSGRASNVPWPMPATPEVVDVAYDNAGNAIRETVTAGTTTLVTTSAYDQRGMEISTTDPRGNLSGADPAAYTATSTFDELGRQITELGAPITVESNGQAPSTVRPLMKIGYNTFGEQVAAQDEAGNIQRWTYDRNGRMASASQPTYLPPGGQSGFTPIVQTRYDGLGNVTEVIDPRGNSSRYSYDQLNRMTARDEPAATNAERAITRYTYTRTGQLLSTVDPLGGRIEATYDDLDRTLTSTSVERKPVADNFTSRFTYDDAGNITRATSPSGAATTSAYDTLGQRIRVTDPNGVFTQFGYDAAGRDVRVADPAGRTTQTVYDSAGRVVSNSDLRPNGTVARSEQYAYDAAGNITATTDSLGVTTRFEYDADDRLVRQIEPVTATSSITTSFGYDAAGRRTRYTNGLGHSTIYTYNTLGSVESLVEPATPAHPNAADRTWIATYDAAGNPVRLTAPGAVNRQSTFDAAGRLTTETGTGASVGTATRTRGYDLLGRLTQVSAPSGSDSFTYNDRGHVLTARGPAGSSDFGYDADGNLTTRTDAAGTARFTYAGGRLSTVTDGLTGAVEQYDYDTSGQLTSINFGSGRIRSYGYDDLGRNISDVVRNGAGQTVTSVTYRYDDNDQLTGKTTTGTAGAGDNSYGYDLAGRLTSWTGPTGTTAYAWDAAGNRTQAGPKTATYDARNRLQADGDYTYAYTARGTLASRTSSGLAERFEFDAFDRMIIAPGTSYAYDGLNRLSSRGGVSFGYAGMSGEPVSDGGERYARGPDDELLAVGSGGAASLVLADEHKDIFGTFSPSDTTLAALSNSTAYEPFGKVIAATGDTGNVGFQGDWTDPATGQVDMGARWYDPGRSGFISRDPTEYPGGDSILANRYTYGAGDPLGFTDPDGYWPSCGWCKKAVNAVSNAVSSAVSWVASGVRNFGRSMREEFDSMRRTFKRAFNAVKSTVKNVVHRVKSAVKSAYHSVKSWGGKQWSKAKSWGKKQWKRAKSWTSRNWDRAKSWAKEKASRAKAAAKRAVEAAKRKALQVKRAAIAKAKKVTQLAKKAAAYAAKHTPLKTVLAVAKPVMAATKKVVSTAAHLPAAAVAVTRDVVSDTVKGATAVYQKAVETAGAVVDGVSNAVSATVEFAQAAAPYLKAGLKIAADLSGASDMIACVTKGDLEACAWTAATIGGYLLGGAGGGAVRAARVAQLASRHADEAADVVKSGRKLLDKVDDCVKPGNSFTGDTRVRMADGTTKPISEVKVGDLVLATDPTTGRTEARAVTDVIIGTGEKDLVELTVGNGEITATAGHPFWIASEQRWVDAGDLETGDMITNSREYRQRQRVYNLTVDGIHTFYVVAGNTDLLVHNDEASRISCPVHDLGWDKGGCILNGPRCGKNGSDELADTIKRRPEQGEKVGDLVEHTVDTHKEFVEDGVVDPTGIVPLVAVGWAAKNALKKGMRRK